MQYVISAVASPFLGAAVDMFGHRVILTTMSAMALVAVHLTFSLAPEGLAHPVRDTPPTLVVCRCGIMAVLVLVAVLVAMLVLVLVLVNLILIVAIYSDRTVCMHRHSCTSRWSGKALRTPSTQRRSGPPSRPPSTRSDSVWPISEDPQRHFDLGPHFDGHVLADIWFPSNIPRLFGPFDGRFG